MLLIIIIWRLRKEVEMLDSASVATQQLRRLYGSDENGMCYDTSCGQMHDFEK